MSDHFLDRRFRKDLASLEQMISIQITKTTTEFMKCKKEREKKTLQIMYVYREWWTLKKTA